MVTLSREDLVLRRDSSESMKIASLCNFMAFLNDKCGHGVGAEYMVDPQNN